MTCTQGRELLWEYAFDLLEPGQKNRVEEHLHGCAGCAQELARLRQVLSSWKEVPAPAGLTEQALRSAESLHLRGTPTSASSVESSSEVEGQAELRPEPALVTAAAAGETLSLPRRRAAVSPWAAAGRWALAAGLLLGVLLSGAYLYLARLTPQRQDTVVIAPSRLLLPGPMTEVPSYGAMRVTVSDGVSRKPVAQASGKLSLVNQKQTPPYYENELCRFETDLAGRADARFLLPGHLLADESERSDLHQLAVEASSSAGHDRFALPVVLARAYRLLLETDGSVYRPGETVRVRGLLADQVMLQPQPYVDVKLELRDSEDRTLAAATAPGTRWGLFSGALVLPAQLLPGTYKVVALVAGFSFAQTVEVMEGEADGAGEQGLSPQPPTVPAGPKAPEGPQAPALRVLVRPEAGVLVPGVENYLYVLVAYPDGRPASAQVTLRSRDAPALSERTDDLGLAVFSLRPGAGGFVGTVAVKADAGEERQVDVSLPVPDPPARVLLRPERWYYRSGEPIKLTLLAPKDVTRVFLDVSQNGQLMCTRTVELTGGTSTKEFTFKTAVAGLLGLVELRAYPAQGQAIAGSVSRRVCIGPASPVHVQAEVEPASAATGSPRLRLTLRDAEGKAVPAPLSVSATALPARVEAEPDELMSSYLLGSGEGGVGRSWWEQLALTHLFSPQAGGLSPAPNPLPLGEGQGEGFLPPGKDRLCLALLGTGTHLVRGQPNDPATALLVARTYPEKAASVARMQERLLPPLAAGLWSVAALLAAAGVAALIAGAGGPADTKPRAALLARAAVAGGAAGLVLLAVIPQAERSRTYRERARVADEQSAPAVLGPAAWLLSGEEGEPAARSAPEPRARRARPETGTRGTRPLRALVWEPEVRTDAEGVALLDLPSLPPEGRLQVSVLALVPAEGGQTTVASLNLVVSVAGTGQLPARPAARRPGGLRVPARRAGTLPLWRPLGGLSPRPGAHPVGALSVGSAPASGRT